MYRDLPYDPEDPDNWPLTEEEKRALREQDRQAMKDAKTDDEHDSAVDKIKRKYG